MRLQLDKLVMRERERQSDDKLELTATAEHKHQWSKTSGQPTLVIFERSLRDAGRSELSQTSSAAEGTKGENTKGAVRRKEVGLRCWGCATSVEVGAN